MENKKRNASISGSGLIAGGEYGSVRISGSGRADGDIKAESMHVSGGAHLQGVDAGELHVSGSCKIEGNIACGDAHISGSCKVDGDADVQKLQTSGSFNVSGELRGSEGRVSGSVTVERGVEFEEMRISGGAHINGLLNAERLFISIGGNSEIGAIGGSDIEIKRGEIRSGLMSALFGNRRYGTVKCALIEGTNVALENTVCEVVRGKNVVIGYGCEIDKVEYTDTLEVSDDAEVREGVKVGA